MSVAMALLGVLAERGAAHGYDLKREHDARFSSSKPLAFGQVYAALDKLTRDGLVEVVEVSRDGGPDRTAYAMTPAGQASLRTWLSEPEPAGPYAADELVRKVVTALATGGDAEGFLLRQREVHLASMRQLVAVQAAATGSTRIGLDHTIAHLDADLRWMETARARVDEMRRMR